MAISEKAAALLTLAYIGVASAQQVPDDAKSDEERIKVWTDLARHWVSETCAASSSQQALCVGDALLLRDFTGYQICNANNVHYVARTKCYNNIGSTNDEYLNQRLKIAEMFDGGLITAAQVEIEFFKLVPMVSVKYPNAAPDIKRLEMWSLTAPRGPIPGLPPGALASFQMMVADRQRERGFNKKK